MPKVNTMLKKHITVLDVYQNRNLNMDFKVDYTLTDNIMLTPQHLELPFRVRNRHKPSDTDPGPEV